MAFGADPRQNRLLAVLPDVAWACFLRQEFESAGPVLHLPLRYAQALIAQMAQTTACNRHHTLEQRLRRWLLMSLDRLTSNELVMTQELIANTLGVRREGSPKPPVTCMMQDPSATIAATSRSGIVPDWNGAPASAMPRSERSANACSRQRRRYERRRFVDTLP